MGYKLARLQEQLARRKGQAAHLAETRHAQVQGRLQNKVLRAQIDEIEPETPVLFRADRESGETCITAVFPTIPADDEGRLMSCFAHVGQHSACCMEWYNHTRAATPNEYADLKAELEAKPYGYRLRVYHRMQRGLFLAARRAALAKMKG